MHGIVNFAKANPSIACWFFRRLLFCELELILNSEANPIVKLVVADYKLLFETHDLPAVEPFLIRTQFQLELQQVWVTWRN
jgi:hypothetical protein